MINFNNLDIKRIMMHEVEKRPNQEHATIVSENSLLALDKNAINLIIKRLTDAAGKKSKAFDLQIGNTTSGGFFDICKDLKNKNDNNFISDSIKIADLLAISQNRTNIPGGYLIVIDSQNSSNNKKVYIVIKAELHEALARTESDNISRINIINDIFLSPSQKLYKIGIIYERDYSNEEEYPNNDFGAFLFDDQFRLDANPAEYFYKSFLGFSASTNSKIQSKKFYTDTSSFIKNNIINYERQSDLLHALKIEFTTNLDDLLSPSKFADRYFEGNELRDLFDSEVSNYLPTCILKDSTLLTNELKKKKIDFKDKIILSGPDGIFDINVQIISNELQLNDLSITNSEYTIVKILGKPNQYE